MRLRDDKRQKTQPEQLGLAFAPVLWGEAPKASAEGTESSMAKRAHESPADIERLMEEVCERGNCQQALKRVKANKGSAGVDGMTVQRVAGLPQAALASHPGTAAEGDLQAAAGTGESRSTSRMAAG